MRYLVIYGSAGCTLCERVRDWAEELSSEFPFSLDYIDVRNDPGLESEYGDDIPIVFLDGRELGRGKIERNRLRELLEEEL